MKILIVESDIDSDSLDDASDTNFNMAEEARLREENENLRAQLAAVTPTTTTQSTVASVSIKIGPFWKRDPELWFMQLEAQFTLSNVTVDTTKYNHLLAKLDADVLECCTDVIRNPPTTDKYKTVKARIIREYTSSAEDRIQQLLRGTELGDRKPSQLLRDMKRLAGGIVTDDALLKTLWLQRLPETTQAVLKVTEDTTDVDTLAEQADKLACIVRNQPSAIMAVNNDQYGFDEMKAQIAALTAEISAIRRQPPHFRNADQQRNGTRNNDNNDYCYFHRRFGAAARKCRDPCKFKPKN